MLSKEDIKRLIAVFATKDDLKELVKKSEFDHGIDSVISKLDAAYGELKDFRQE